MLFSLVHAGNAVSASKANLVYGETGRVDTFDPFTIHEASGHRLTDLLFDSLVSVGDGGSYVSELAQSWKIDRSGTAVAFTLRKNAYWHGTGRKERVTAKDVATTVRLLLAAKSEIPNRERFQAISSAEVSGSNKVTIRLRRAMADPLRVMMFKILPSHVLAGEKALKRTSKFARHPVGSGPYLFKGSNNQGEVMLVANPHYFKGRPEIKKIVMKSYADQNVMAQSLMFNSLDLVTNVSPRDIDEVSGDRRITVVPYDALSFTFFAMNTSRVHLQDRRVRQAISHAVNRKEMLQAFFNGRGNLVSGPFPPTSWAYNIDVKPLEYSTKRARELLKQAGFQDKNKDGKLEDRDGRPIRLSFAVPLAGESEMVKRIVLAFQQYMAGIGLTVDLKFMDWLVWKQQVLGKHDYDLTIASWSFDDASNIRSLFHSSSATAWGNNFVMYRNPEVDSLLTEAEVTNSFDKRRMIYHKLHAILTREAPYAYLWNLKNHAAHDVNLSGVRVEPFNFFKHIVKWRVGNNNG